MTGSGVTRPSHAAAYAEMADYATLIRPTSPQRTNENSIRRSTRVTRDAVARMVMTRITHVAPAGRPGFGAWCRLGRGGRLCEFVRRPCLRPAPAATTRGWRHGRDQLLCADGVERDFLLVVHGGVDVVERGCARASPPAAWCRAAGRSPRSRAGGVAALPGAGLMSASRPLLAVAPCSAANLSRCVSVGATTWVIIAAGPGGNAALGLARRRRLCTVDAGSLDAWGLD